MTEAEVIETINKIAHGLSYIFRFGYHDAEDIEQLSWQFAIEGLQSYDGVRPLHSFLYIHIRNRLINYKRKHFARLDSPCELCHECKDGITAHEDGEYCGKYLKWIQRNDRKKSLATPVSINNISPANLAVDAQDILEKKEIQEKIDGGLSAAMRRAYLKYINGVPISNTTKQKLITKLREILCKEHKEEED